MKLVHTIKEVRKQIDIWKKEGLTIGFVPTMGYLHEGHQSLIERAVKENDCVVVSIFVNPMQFGPKEDLSTYPRDLEKDSLLCEKSGVKLIFNPEPSEMYTSGFASYLDMNGLTEGLCGKSRPTHFRGVCTVVMKLFNIVAPDNAYFGEKDAQQLAVIKRMVKDFNVPINIVGCPIVREADGLAKSSRNTYLSKEERKAALILSRSLDNAKCKIKDGVKESAIIREGIEKELQTEPLAKIDYIEIVKLDTMKPISKIEENTLVAIAVYIGKTRLIDNFII